MTNAQQQSSIEALISHDEFTGVTTLLAIHNAANYVGEE